MPCFGPIASWESQLSAKIRLFLHYFCYILPSLEVFIDSSKEIEFVPIKEMGTNCVFALGFLQQSV